MLGAGSKNRSSDVGVVLEHLAGTIEEIEVATD
jgi:hypothetical protein